MADQNSNPTGDQNPAPANDQTPPDTLANVSFDDGEELDVNQTPEGGDPPPANAKPNDGEQTPPPESGDPAGTPPEDGDKKDKPVNQEAVEKKINTLTFQKHEERRKREEAETRAQELKEKLEALDKKDSDIVIPPVPDTFDPDYEKKLAEREAAIKKQAQVDYDKQVLERQKTEAQQAEIARQQEAIQKSVTKMYDGAKTLGFKEEDFKKADLRVSQFIQHPQLAQHILEHDDGPALVMYLSSNAAELEKVAQMNPIDAGVYLATKVVSKAKDLKPQPSKTPAPLDIDEGRVPKPDGSPYLNGVTFE